MWHHEKGQQGVRGRNQKCVVVGASDAVADTDAMGCIVECMCVCVCVPARCAHTGAHIQAHTAGVGETVESRVSRVWSVVTPIHGKQVMTSCGSCLFVLAVAWSGRRLVHASSLRPPFSSAARPLVLLRSFVPTPPPFVFSLRLLPSSSPFVFSFFFRVSSLCCFRRRPCCILLVASACLPLLL